MACLDYSRFEIKKKKCGLLPINLKLTSCPMNISPTNCPSLSSHVPPFVINRADCTAACDCKKLFGC